MKYTKAQKAKLGVQSHFLDSGSFSLWTREAKKFMRENPGAGKYDYYDTKEFFSYMDSYAEFIKRYSVGIDFYANVDVIPNPELTWRNQQYLEREHDLHPVPVVHYTTNLKWLKFYMDEGYEFIALGGMVGSTSQESCQTWLDKCFELVCPKPSYLPTIKLHGFGITTYELILRYPWYCFTDDHKVLTRSGWKGRRELAIGEEILTYNDGETRWEPILEIPTFNVKDENISHLYNEKIKGIDAFVSDNHRWRVVRRGGESHIWKETHELTCDHRIPKVGDYVGAPKKKVYSDDFVKLVAWFWTEGTIRNHSTKRGYKKPSVGIYQSMRANPHKVKKIRRVLKNLKEKFCESTCKRDNCIMFELYGDNRDRLLKMFPEKKLSYEFILNLTRDQLESFIYTSMIADGHICKMKSSENFHMTLRQKDNKNTEQFRLAGILAGYTSSVITTNRGMVEVRFCKTENTKFAAVASLREDRMPFTGTLWCVRVPSGAFLTKCNECVYVTGNSVDSTSWTKVGGFGGILVPHKRGGHFVFSEQPYVIKTSDETPDIKIKGKHYNSMSKGEQKVVREWLDYIGIPLGRIVNGKKVENGVLTRHIERKAANIHFFEEMRHSLPDWPWPFRNKRRKGLGVFM